MYQGLPGYDPWRGIEGTGLWFDQEAADRACQFFPECLRHIEGAMAGKPFVLEPWQRALIGNLFGWKRADGYRRYREVMLYVPRKNGKTPIAAGICLLVLFCDHEPGAQIICAAGNTEQASLLFRHASGMVGNEPELKSRAMVFAGAAGTNGARTIVLRDDPASSYKVISSDADTKHGGNLHLALIDELHVQPNADLVDTITTSMASENRKQPMTIYITTADYDRPSVCNEKYEYACKVRDGAIVNHSFLPVIYEITAADDWTTEAAWRKANPNLGVSVSREYMEMECKRAQAVPRYQNTFLRLHLNFRTQSDVKWLSLDKWDLGGAGGRIDEETLRGEECWGALDLSTKIDLTAWVLVFPPNLERCRTWWTVLPRFFAPEVKVKDRKGTGDGVDYSVWVRSGHLIATPGEIVDYEYVKSVVQADAAKFTIRDIGFDQWNATKIATELEEEAGRSSDEPLMIEFGQGFRSMSEPTKELEALVIGGKLRHGGNPILRWMAGHVTVETDPAGNIKPSKKRSKDRIDGIVATVMALGRAMVGTASGNRPSVYESGGLDLLTSSPATDEETTETT